MPNNNIFSAASLQVALGARPFRFYPQVGSTNDSARQWALEGAPAGSVVITEEQFAGRGRFGRTWSAPAGTALLMSVIVRPRIPQEQLPRLTMVGAVSVAEALEELLPAQVGLKWPNDVQLQGKKVAGILAEIALQAASLETAPTVIVGIGLNVRVDFRGTPLEDQAVSVESVPGKPVDRGLLLGKILRRIDYWAMRAQENALLVAWQGRLTTLGQIVSAQLVSDQANKIVGLAVGVDADGALLLQTHDGNIHRIVAGDVTLVK